MQDSSSSHLPSFSPGLNTRGAGKYTSPASSPLLTSISLPIPSHPSSNPSSHSYSSSISRRLTKDHNGIANLPLSSPYQSPYQSPSLSSPYQHSPDPFSSSSTPPLLDDDDPRRTARSRRSTHLLPALLYYALLSLAAIAALTLLFFTLRRLLSSSSFNPLLHSQRSWAFAASSNLTAPHLVVLVPLIAEDVPRVMAGIRKWAALGPVCDTSQELPMALRFLYSRTREHYDALSLPYLEQMMAQEAIVVARVSSCFQSIETIFSELREEQDGYPEGPSHMFFKLLIHQHATLLQPFSHGQPALTASAHALVHVRLPCPPCLCLPCGPSLWCVCVVSVYWMEWDVKPIRAYWAEKLFDLTLHDEFWVKGGRYRGRAFDEVIKDSSSWTWVGHLNGNALYRLHDDDFNAFLQLTVEREPPSHYWKPFDIAMWRTLVDFPYNWHLYQTYGDRFQTTAAMQHLGFTGTDEEFATVVHHSPNVFLIHGDRGSAGLSKYLVKFKDGVPSTNTTVQWSDEVSPAMRVSVFIRTAEPEFPFAALAIQSAQRFLAGALEYVVVVPEADAAAARQALPGNIVLYEEKKVVKEEAVQAKLTKLQAELYCMGSYIFHLDADVVLYRPVLRRDLFIFHRPILRFDRYENLQWLEEERFMKQQHAKAEQGDDPLDDPLPRQWQEGTSYALGQKVEFEFSRSNDHLYPRSVYAEARAHIERLHGMSLPAFLDTREAWLRFDSAGGVSTQMQRLFSDFNYLGAFLYYQQPQAMSWTYLGVDKPPVHALPYAFTSIRPDVVCQGDLELHRPWAKRKVALQSQVSIMQRIVNHGAHCSELHKFVADSKQ